MLGGAVAAVSLAGVVGTRETRIVSPPGGSPSAGAASDATSYNEDGGHPGNKQNPVIGGDRPARNINFSQDNRQILAIAYDSAAANLVPGDSNGVRDIFVMKRSKRFDGTLLRASVSSSEHQANGESIKPSLDGQAVTGGGAVKPKCVVFQSKATNLAPGDSSTDWDVYLRNLHTGKTKLLSGGVSDDARDPVVDGHCRTVTFEAGGKVYVQDIGSGKRISIANGYNPDQQTDGEGVAYDRGGQVYYHAFKPSAHASVKSAGGEKLVSNSAANSSRGGNGPSSDPAVNDSGAYVFFESKATDLCINRCQGVSTDRNGDKSDTFRRTLRPVKGVKGSSSDEMQMVSYDGTRDVQGNLDSDQVRTTGAGEQACFRSFAKNFREIFFDSDGFPGPFMHIYFWNFPRERRIGALSGESKPGRSDEFKRNDTTPAFSWSCDISNRGSFLGFTSDEEGESGETNGREIPDAFIRFMGGSDEGHGGNF